jgi:hypothetical protein
VAEAKDARGKFNAGLAVAKVAEATKSVKLEGAVLALLDDKQNNAAKLAGMKAAKAILPELIKTKSQQKVVDRVVAAVKAYPSGAISSEAYEALRDKATVDALLAVLDFRTSLYQKGLPEDPNADAIPFLFLQGVWQQGPTEQQKVKMLEDACHLLVLAAAHADVQPSGTYQREQFAYVVQKVSESLSILSKYIPAPGLEAEAQKLAKLAVTAGTALSPVVKPTCAEIRKIKGCEKVEEPKMDAPPSTNPVTP